MESNSTSLARSQTNNANSPLLNPECTTPKKAVKKRTSTDGSGISLQQLAVKIF